MQKERKRENEIHRTHKSRIFEMIFSDKRKLLELYEHQSTYSPNLPLRYLMYISDLYSRITKDANLYDTRLVKLPTPRFLIFYNGREELPDTMELRLSDAFQVREESYSLEFKATLLNINAGHNSKLLSACRTLGYYAEYTRRVRNYAEIMDLKEAVEKAIEECIRDEAMEFCQGISDKVD